MILIFNNTDPNIRPVGGALELGSKQPPFAEVPLGPPPPADPAYINCQCLTGTAYIDETGACRCWQPQTTQPIRTGPGMPIRWWPGAPGFYPIPGNNPPVQPQPAPVTPAPVNPNHDEEDLWFGYEPWKVVAAAAAIAGVGYIAYQGAPK